jgi:hypothetical protein
MDPTTSAQTYVKHEIVDSLDREFARLHARSRTIIENTPLGNLYQGASADSKSGHNSTRSVGESVLRAAAAIEQTFGGITSNLWDDPFEWTLPEYLATVGKVLEHLEEVEAVRRRAFSSFNNDECLLKHVATPAKESERLIDLLVQTLRRAISFQTEAAVTLKALSGIGTPGLLSG